MVKIGDMVPKAGIYTKPGVVTQKSENGMVTIDTDPLAINQYHRHSNTTGLNETDKLKFNEILDRIYQFPDDAGRVTGIQEEIEKLETNPENKGIVQYLRNQQMMLIRRSGSTPRTYQWDEQNLSGGIEKTR
jgi:hypothetical protein